MNQLAECVEILARTPRVLRELLVGVSETWTQGRYGEGTWSSQEVVGHLVVAEREDWMVRLRRILQDGESRAFDPFAHDATAAGGRTMGELIDEFAQLRAGNLQELHGLKLMEVDLLRTGMHPALGRVTAGQLLSTWAVHDLHHLRQIGLAMAWQYRDAVGPWRAYLNTLKR